MIAGWHLEAFLQGGALVGGSLQQGATFTSPLPPTISTANYNISTNNCNVFSLFQTCCRPVFPAGTFLLMQANTTIDAKESLRLITSFWDHKLVPTRPTLFQKRHIQHYQILGMKTPFPKMLVQNDKLTDELYSQSTLLLPNFSQMTQKVESCWWLDKGRSCTSSTVTTSSILSDSETFVAQPFCARSTSIVYGSTIH